MVARTGEDERIDIALRSASAEVADLPALAADWPTLPRLSRESKELEWSDLMDRLESVADADCAGELSPAQKATYRRLLLRLRDYLPLTRTLDLPVPEKLVRVMPAPQRAEI